MLKSPRSVLLLLACAGAISSFASLPRFSALVSLVVAAGIGIEQVVRLSAFRRGPAGSILGALVRPFARKLLR